MSRIALITCRQLPEPDHDEELLLETLRGAGLEAELLAWDYEGAEPERFDLCVPRSCWNYFHDTEAFLAFVERAELGSRLVNSREVIQWNLHKGYLSELERAGVPIVPTAFLSRGEAATLGEVARERGWSDVVVKPTVSAASYRTRRFAPEDKEGQFFLDFLLGEGDVLVQEYMCGVEDPGERALVWIDGEITHAVRKSARFADGQEEVSEALPISAEERELGERALAAAGKRIESDLLYARIDVVPDVAGDLRLSELELIEPSLFLLQHRPALDRLVAAMRRLANGD